MSKIKLVMYLDYGCQKREMTVAYAPGGKTCYSERSRTIEPVPMLRITNRLLLNAGFKVGSKVSVEYGQDIITVRKLHNHESNNLQKPRCPKSDPVSGTAATSDAGQPRGCVALSCPTALQYAGAIGNV